jgi:hypothetical protein
MLKRSIFLGLCAAVFLQLASVKADAAIVHPSLGIAADKLSGLTDVRWVCGPYRCAWIPNYRGKVVVYPHMRGWVRPRSPHCYYARGIFGGWTLICP